MMKIFITKNLNPFWSLDAFEDFGLDEANVIAQIQTAEIEFILKLPVQS